MSPERLREGWSPRRIGRRIVVLPETTSTSTIALEAAADPSRAGAGSRPEVDGLAVFADYQAAGRGRQGREWLSPRGASILCSVLLIVTQDRDDRSDQPPSQLGGWLTLAAAVAACEAIREATELTPAIKWPNDLRLSGRKLGGILIESRPLAAPPPADASAWVVGIGINCLQQAGHFPPELSGRATSLDLEASHPIDRTAVARELLRRLDHWLAGAPARRDESVHDAWLKYAEPIGQRVRLVCAGRQCTGSTLTVDPAGGLIVQTDDGRREWFDPMLTTLL